LAIDARLAYVENEILQADPIRLVQMLYRGALLAIGKARVHVRERDIAGRSRQLTKASEIINELTLSIDTEKGGEIARNLVELYDYMQRRLQDANFRQVEEPLIELESLLGTILDAWEQCAPGTAEPKATDHRSGSPYAAPPAEEVYTYAPAGMAANYG
jgi:flagellar secretion chaperone FliS